MSAPPGSPIIARGLPATSSGGRIGQTSSGGELPLQRGMSMSSRQKTLRKLAVCQSARQHRDGKSPGPFSPSPMDVDTYELILASHSNGSISHMPPDDIRCDFGAPLFQKLKELSPCFWPT